MRAVLGITMGDPAGIGAETIVKALSAEEIYDVAMPFVIGDGAALREAASHTDAIKLRRIALPGELEGAFGTVEYIEPLRLRREDWKYGEISAPAGAAAFAYIEKAIGLALNHEIDAVVTGPINKEAIHLAGKAFSGHTEIFASRCGAEDYAMLLISGKLRVIHVSTHVSLREACEMATRQRVLNVIKMAQQSLELLGIPKGKIAVAGLNPHCSENGLFGNEEKREIIPAIEDALSIGLNVEGPVPPDTVFVKALGGRYDIVVAMYHDQGHIPLKLSGFQAENGRLASVSGINVTVGLPVIRTSVDHGTAFDIAGKGLASGQSMTEAILLAAKIAEGKR